MSIQIDKHTIAMVLGLLFPGSGHILIGKDKTRRGICIAIAFVAVSYTSGIILNAVINSNPTLRELPPEIFYPITALGFIPSFAIWLFQLFDLSKIIKKEANPTS